MVVRPRERFISIKLQYNLEFRLKGKPIKQKKRIDSDHNTMIARLSLNIEQSKVSKERNEIFNFKDEKSKEAFKTNTSETEEFTDCFEVNLSREMIFGFVLGHADFV